MLEETRAVLQFNTEKILSLLLRKLKKQVGRNQARAVLQRQNWRSPYIQMDSLLMMGPSDLTIQKRTSNLWKNLTKDMYPERFKISIEVKELV